MKTLEELLAVTDPAITDIRKWAAQAKLPIELLPPSDSRDRVLLDIQVTTKSVLGAMAYETGGILIDGGWLRLLGSGHERLTRTLPDWNKGRAEGFYLVADDIAGGFFAINGGALGKDFRKMYYFAPDRLEWEAMEIEFSQFVFWSLTDERLTKYYEEIRWPGWREDAARIHGDRCYFSFPPMWTKEGKADRVQRSDIPVSEAWGLSLDFKSQLGRGPLPEQT